MDSRRRVSDLPTPCILIDRFIFNQNCVDMHDNARRNGMLFRAHVKSHKTAEGTRMMLRPKGIEEVDSDLTGRTIISTVEEGWGMVRDGLLEDGTVNDILFSLPPSPNQLVKLLNLRKALPTSCVLRLMVDDPEQIRMLDESLDDSAEAEVWSVFVKVDCGGRRAGLIPEEPQFEALVRTIFSSKRVRIFGFYSHAGQSYASRDSAQASSYLQSEIDAVNEAALIARRILSSGPTVVQPDALDSARNLYKHEEWVLSVGATPTAHAARAYTEGSRETGRTSGGKLELHAGVYPLNDLQQLATGLISTSQIALSVLSTVNSTYPGRGAGSEACCDAGGLAMSKDTGPEEGFGRVIGCRGLEGWRLGRISQEHGILTHPHANTSPPIRSPRFGELLRIIPQHACLTLANHAVYFVVDSNLEAGTDWKEWTVREEWRPWKFW